MPIHPDLKPLYPKNWTTEIRPAILKRANNRCEFCGVPNYAVGYWDRFTFFEITEARSIYEIKIVLTISHLDHDPTNNDPKNLRALCQRCHNRWDAKNRARNRKRRIEKKNEQLYML